MHMWTCNICREDDPQLRSHGITVEDGLPHDNRFKFAHEKCLRQRKLEGIRHSLKPITEMTIKDGYRMLAFLAWCLNTRGGSGSTAREMDYRADLMKAADYESQEV